MRLTSTWRWTRFAEIGRRAARRLGAAGLGLLLASNLGGPARAAPPYQLGPMDRIKIVVSEWSSAGGEIRIRLTGDFTVDAAGLLSVPMIGTIQAAGQTPIEVSQTISDRMQARAGLINPPVTAIEIIQYRPFYILGFVEKPGEYPYRPGMSVLQAVAIAGGVFRVPNAAHLRLERDAVSALGEAGLQRGRLDELLIRRARVQAELAGRNSVELPTEMADRSGDRNLVLLLQKEQSNLVARRDALAASIREQRELRKLAQDEEVSLRDQLKAQEQRLAVVEREADETRSLKARGLTTSAREFSIAAAAAEVEVRKRALYTEILRAGQSIVRADQAVRMLQSERSLQLLAELDSLRTALEEAESRRRTAEGLLDEAETTAQLYGSAPAAQDRAPSYLVIRRTGDHDATMVASDLTEVLPGDLIRVVPPPSLQRPWESAGGPGRRG
jgi:protein involved in polysaccharide export with SLBB domain